MGCTKTIKGFCEWRKLIIQRKNRVLNGLDLFSGIGGISLALSEWVRPIAYCEQDRFCQAVLMSRMQSGELPTAPIWDDVRTLRAELVDWPIDIIYGGFPCQDISTCNLGEGLEGARSGLFYEIVRLSKEIKPEFIFLENVSAIRKRGLGTVVTELAAIGYDCRWTMLSASEVGANHKRERWFLLAHSNGERLEGDEAQTNKREKYISNNWHSTRPGSVSGDWWKSEPELGRVANGIPHRVDRLRGLGNAVVPLQAREAFERLCGLK